MSFPNNFAWGAATASYQIEGAYNEDGKGLSVWDTFCKKKGAVLDGQSGETACDHYHKYAEDIGIMKQIGIKAYRFSVSWPRLIPDGVGKINPKGLEFYDKLVDNLLSAGIVPYITLFHWDYPNELYCRGGWLNRDTSDWFAEYAAILADKLSDRVKNWITLNEPYCFVVLGHYEGIHAPGDKLQFPQILRITHNVLLSHGKAVKAIRAVSKQQSRIGLSHVGIIKVPGTDSREDIEAARQAILSITEKNIRNNTWWLDPIFFGKYPDDGLALFGEAVPEIQNGDMETISQPLDFLGLNIYSGQRIQADGNGKYCEIPKAPGYDMTTYKWEIIPEALHWGTRFLWERYKKPVYITENGMSNTDWISLDGKVHDPQRINFLKRYLIQLKKAIDSGVKVNGYFLWSLLDNFEWHEGYRERFGIVYVHYPTQKRVLKNSAYWYKKVIASNGKDLENIM
ncbi:MAG: GH1 family beta-glucosidase [Planctomycetota bacterium]